MIQEKKAFDSKNTKNAAKQMRNKVSAFVKDSETAKNKKENDEKHFEERAADIRESLQNQAKTSRKKKKYSIKHKGTVNSAVSNSTAEFKYKSNSEHLTKKPQIPNNSRKITLSQNYHRNTIYKHSSPEQAQRFKLNGEQLSIIAKRRDFSYKKAFDLKMKSRHKYYSELTAQAAKSMYEMYKKQDTEQEEHNNTIADSANKEFYNTINHVKNTAVNTATDVIQKTFSANKENKHTYTYNNEATFKFNSDNVQNTEHFISDVELKKELRKKAAQEQAEITAKKIAAARASAAKKAAITGSSVSATTGTATGATSMSGGAAASGTASGTAAGASSGTPAGLVMLAVGAIVLLVLIILILIIVVLNAAAFPFGYITSKFETVDDEGNTYVEEIHEENEISIVVQHYHSILNQLVDKFNTETIDALIATAKDYNNTGVINPELKAQYDEAFEKYDMYICYPDLFAYTYPGEGMPPIPEKDYYYTTEELTEKGMERGRIFEGFRWSNTTDAERVPQGKLYNEVLAALAAYNIKCWTKETEETEAAETTTAAQEENTDEATDEDFPDIKFEYLDDGTVSSFYGSMNFWEFKTWEESVDCSSEGRCCTKKVTKTIYDENGDPTGTTTETVYYCPGHYCIMMDLQLYFDMDRVFEILDFNKDDEKNYKEELKEIKKNT